jgi:hypothetical protein
VRVLTAKWGTASRVSPSDTGVVTGESTGDEPEAEKPLAEKPLFIYVTDGASDGGFDKIEKVILDDNKVLVGMKAFKCVKMTTEDVENDPLLSGKSKDERYFLFVSRDYEDVKAIDGNKMKTKTVYSTMKKFAQREYKTKFEKTVKATLKLLLEYDKINNAKKVLEAKKQREGDDLSKGEARKIEKELEELAERQKKNEELEKKLTTWELKA